MKEDAIRRRVHAYRSFSVDSVDYCGRRLGSYTHQVRRLLIPPEKKNNKNNKNIKKHKIK